MRAFWFRRLATLHIGSPKAWEHPTLADAKETCDWRIYRDVAQPQLRLAREACAHGRGETLGGIKESEHLEFDAHRFYREADYTVAKLREPAFREAWSHFEIRLAPEYPNMYKDPTWGQFFAESAVRADSMFASALTQSGHPR